MIDQRDAITSALASSAVTTPLWLPHLDEAAKLAAFIYSVLGAVWLATQMWRAWFRPK